MRRQTGTRCKECGVKECGVNIGGVRQERGVKECGVNRRRQGGMRRQLGGVRGVCGVSGERSVRECGANEFPTRRQ